MLRFSSNLLLALAPALALACSKPQQATPQAARSHDAAAQPSAPRPPAHELTFTGMCDASGGVPLDEHRFLVADDEDNVLRAYDTTKAGAPIWSVDVSSAVGVLPKSKKPGKAPPETDIEAATRVGELAFWMTSHGRNSSGKLKRERLKLFATNVPKPGQELAVVGKPYDHLLDDILAEPRLERFGLRAAAELAPKAPGGLNLEGMTARREGGVWVGFRNPLPENKAILVPLLNPERLIEGEPAKFGEPLLLDLGGHGVRAISTQGGRYLLLAGPFDSGAGTRLFSWDGVGEARPAAPTALAGLNGEGFFSPGGERVLILSDDGSQLVEGQECKRLKDAAKKRFRARWVKP